MGRGGFGAGGESARGGRLEEVEGAKAVTIDQELMFSAACVDFDSSSF